VPLGRRFLQRRRCQNSPATDRTKTDYPLVVCA